jgi:chemotaxis protein CheZ
MSALQKPYRIEAQFPNQASFVGAEPRPFAIEMQQRLDTLAQDMGEIKELVRPSQEIARDVVDSYRREIIEVFKLKTEMTAISTSIEETRRQLASMHANTPRAINLDRMTGELGAVVGDTANATNDILASAEGIQEVVSALKVELTSSNCKAHLDQVQDLTQKIFESCNFQDLTGQRITRIVETLAFIESRVDRMMEIWGGLETIDKLIAEETAAMHAERETEGAFVLVNGPKIADDEGHVDQSDIDALFN